MNKIARHMRLLCESALDIAETLGVNIVVVAIDRGGHPVVVLRGDEVGFPALEAARRKAVAAATLRMSTSAAVTMFESDPLVTIALSCSGDLLMVPGGFPVMLDEHCIGGLGIAGGHYSQDDLIGQKAIAAAGSARDQSRGITQ